MSSSFLVGDMCHNSVRTETYPKTDVLIMCFAIDQPNSLWKVAHRWKPEVKRYCPGGTDASPVVIEVCFFSYVYIRPSLISPQWD